ncbi:MAG: hypothetical protein ABI601_00880 [bacterium]
MTRQDVAALQARKSELTGQLESAVRQRRQISEQLRRAEGVDKTGLESRIGVIDARITRIEGELDQVSEQPAWKRGSLRSQPALTSDSGQRLERIEQAMDAIAIEVERVSEGQRFVTRLLSERGGGALGAGPQAAESARIPLSDVERVR